jgi:hypothetical protein
VIPREGVERLYRRLYITLNKRELLVIPREGVESLKVA